MTSTYTTIELPVIPREQFIKVKEFPAAMGGYGQVFQCIMRPPAAPETLVAVKVLIHATADSSKKRADHEMRLWMEARHENLVPVLGITNGFSENGFAIVYPWMQGGSLARYLNDNEGNVPHRKKMTLVKDVASGLAYLHSHQIVHGDLTTNNVMLDDSGRALLSDFGFSNILSGMADSSLSLSAARPGAIRFAAPELLGVEEAPSQITGQGSPVDNEPPMPDIHSDIYSLGCVMLNVFTEKRPWYPYLDIAVAGLQQTRRPMPILDHSHLSERCKQFICECTSVQVDGRPSSQDAVDFIEEELKLFNLDADATLQQRQNSHPPPPSFSDNMRSSPTRRRMLRLHFPIHSRHRALAPFPKARARVLLGRFPSFFRRSRPDADEATELRQRPRRSTSCRARVVSFLCCVSPGTDDNPAPHYGRTTHPHG